MENIKVWDVVNSIWWSLPMTVENLIVIAECTRFDEEGNLQRDTFWSDALELHTKEIE